MNLRLHRQLYLREAGRAKQPIQPPADQAVAAESGLIALKRVEHFLEHWARRVESNPAAGRNVQELNEGTIRQAIERGEPVLLAPFGAMDVGGHRDWGIFAIRSQRRTGTPLLSRSFPAGQTRTGRRVDTSLYQCGHAR